MLKFCTDFGPVLKNLAYFKKNGNTLGTIKDSINPMISNSITITKDNSAAYVLDRPLLLLYKN